VKRFALLLTVLLALVVFSNLNVTNAQQQRKNMMGWTPLHTALSREKWEITEMLVSKNPDFNASDNQGRTPLYIAVEKGQMKFVEILLAKKVDVNTVARGGQNALTVARGKGNKEMEELLLKHGAEEPVLDMEGDLYYGMRGDVPGGMSTPGAATAIRPLTPARPANEPSPLEDPNEIKARIKTFEGMGKAIKEIADKSVSEERQWRQTRYDNRMLLSKAVQTQFDGEMALIKKSAVEEKAEKTITTIDTLVSQKQARQKNVYKELVQQRRLGQTQGMVPGQVTGQTQMMGRGRGRGRTSGRGGRGRSTMRGGQYGDDMGMGDSYYGGSDMGDMARPTRPTRPQEQIDPLTEADIRLWTQATIQRKNELLKSVHEQIMAEMDSVRFVAKEEEAKKTMAAIDGVMLARLMRYDQLVLNMEEDVRKAEERQLRLEQRGYGRGRGGQLQGDSTQQQNMQQRGRSRRR
jgi:hypothetical protein